MSDNFGNMLSIFTVYTEVLLKSTQGKEDIIVLFHISIVDDDEQMDDKCGRDKAVIVVAIVVESRSSRLADV